METEELEVANLPHASQKTTQPNEIEKLEVDKLHTLKQSPENPDNWRLRRWTLINMGPHSTTITRRHNKWRLRSWRLTWCHIPQEPQQNTQQMEIEELESSHIPQHKTREIDELQVHTLPHCTTLTRTIYKHNGHWGAGDWHTITFHSNHETSLIEWRLKSWKLTKIENTPSQS